MFHFHDVQNYVLQVFEPGPVKGKSSLFSSVCIILSEVLLHLLDVKKSDICTEDSEDYSKLWLRKVKPSW